MRRLLLALVATILVWAGGTGPVAAAIDAPGSPPLTYT
jgi:hypothetical protein